MSLRKDTRYILGKYVLGKDKEYEPKVPDKETILKQVNKGLRKGKLSGSVKLDIEASKLSKEEEER